MSNGRIIILIVDACGVGELPDAGDYGDHGAATLPHVAAEVGGLTMPVCQELGLGNIALIQGIPAAQNPCACYGRMAEVSAGKDSTTGHWEIGGVVLPKPFPLFPDGFPAALVKEFEKRAGVTTMGNIPASGTEIIKKLGARHLQTGELILYTSADSVFQLAAHEQLYPLERQYEICRVARELLKDEYGVARVIARPFVGEPGAFVRTSGRRDFSLPPPEDTILDLLTGRGHDTLAVGKTYDLFAQRGFSNRISAKNNAEVMLGLRDAVRDDTEHSLIFANCVDFDMLWGHRNDTEGFAQGLEEFDRHLAEILPMLRPYDVLIITADHGCDPTLKSSTDHTREYVPLLAFGKSLKAGVDMGTRKSFSDVACTVAAFFELRHSFPGKSFLADISQASS